MSLASAFLRKLTSLLLFAFFVSHKLIFLPLGFLLVDPLSIFFLCVPTESQGRVSPQSPALFHPFFFDTKCLFDRNALFLSLLVNLRPTCETSCGASSKLFSTLCVKKWIDVVRQDDYCGDSAWMLFP